MLVVDDNPAILEDYRKVLGPVDTASDLQRRADAFFADDPIEDAAGGDGDDGGGPPSRSVWNEQPLEIDTAAQGADAVERVQTACAAGDPYALVICDMRMPPGYSGLETLRRIGEIDRHVQTVICSAYSDYRRSEIVEALGDTDRLLILRKPFDPIEVIQIASALTAKWDLAQQVRSSLAELEARVDDRTAQLKRRNGDLNKALRQRDAAQESLRRAATRDGLTGLCNRTRLMEQLSSFADTAAGGGTEPYAVLFLDIDNFKVINDGIGHAAGDTVLKEMACRLTRAADLAVDRSPGTRAVVARLGGDEFVLGFQGPEVAATAQAVAQRIQSSLAEQPFDLGSRTIHVRTSIGIAVARDPTDRPERLLTDADLALYRAKSAGRGGAAAFDAPMRAAAELRVVLEADLRGALDRGELWVAYQPIVTLESGRITGAEALVRWDHPERGPIPPDRFISIAEEAGLIERLGAWVLDQACAQAAEWPRVDGQALSLSVNVSPQQVLSGGMPEQVRKTLGRTGLAPERLRLEITEGLLLRDTPEVRRSLVTLRAMGVGIVLDDFGTGYSSLAYLHQIPIDGIKLDRSFICQLGQRGQGRNYTGTVLAVVMMASNRGIPVVAEGIETADQLVQLQTLDCELGQGFYFSQPLPPAAFRRLIAGRNATRRSA